MPFREYDYPNMSNMWIIFLSMWGGLVCGLRSKSYNKFKIYTIFSIARDLITSTFTGMLAFLLCEESKIPEIWTAAIVAMSGYMGTQALDKIVKIIQARFFNK